MGGIFGFESTSNAPQPAQVDEEDVSILDLKAQRDQLVGQRKRADKMVAKDEQAARDLVLANKKPLAMLALRKKKLHEQMALDCSGHVGRLDELVMNIEAARVQKEVVDALKVGVATLKKVQKEMGSADYVQKLMDEHADLTADMQEIGESLAGAGVAADDEEALEALAKLEAEMAAQATIPAAPAAPTPAAAAPAAPAAEAAPVPERVAEAS